MRIRTTVLLFGAATATGAAVIGAATATLLAERSTDRLHRGLVAISEIALTMPPFDAADDHEPRLRLVRNTNIEQFSRS